MVILWQNCSPRYTEVDKSTGYYVKFSNNEKIICIKNPRYTLNLENIPVLMAESSGSIKKLKPPAYSTSPETYRFNI